MARAVRIFKHFETPVEEGHYYRLVCLTGETKGTAYFLMGNRVVIGRGDTADVKVLDIKASREHAEIVKVGMDFVVTDLGSQNGVVVNDLKIKQHILNPGDKIIIGQTVFSFSEVFVDGKQQNSANEDSTEVHNISPKAKNKNSEADPKKKKVSPVLVAAILIGLTFLLLNDDEAVDTGKRQSTDGAYKVTELNDPFAQTYKKAKQEDRVHQEKLERYFHQGLREYREGNYFRAMAEFQHALAWKPKDALAEFYLRKTREALDNKIEDYFLSAKRDEESLKYHSAIVSYCSIVRLLFNYKEDERYKNAIAGIEHVEKLLGQESSGGRCFEEGQSSFD